MILDIFIRNEYYHQEDNHTNMSICSISDMSEEELLQRYYYLSISHDEGNKSNIIESNEILAIMEELKCRAEFVLSNN